MTEAGLAQLDDSPTGSRVPLEEVPLLDFAPLLHASGSERKRAALEIGRAKEGTKVGRDLPLDHPPVRAGLPLHGPNQWPLRPAGMEGDDAGRLLRLGRLGREIMHAFALALELPETYFDRWLGAQMATLSSLHYPAERPHHRAAHRRGSAYRIGCLTILAQDPVGGLQVRNSASKWIDAPYLPGSFVVNIGDMMERWTNGLFASTLHRVINSSGQDRYSLLFFFDPDFNAWRPAPGRATRPNDSDFLAVHGVDGARATAAVPWPEP